MTAVPLLDAATLAAAGRQPPVPFRMACAEGELTVRRLLRVLPGKRIVGEGEYDGRRVLAKLFVGSGAERRWRQENEGLAALAAQALPTPAVLLSVPMAAGGHVLLTEFMAPSSTLGDEWNALPQPVTADAAALAVLCPAFALLGRMHVRGLVQEDLHLGNFLRAAGKVYVIDGDSVRAISPSVPLGAVVALPNLALLLAQLPAEWDTRPEPLLAAYCTEHPAAEVELSLLQYESARIRAARLDAFLEKTTRDCTLFAVKQHFERFTAVVRSEAEELEGVLSDPDALFSQGRILKDGNSSTVVGADIGQRVVVVKRYNLKNVGHALRRSIQVSRAWHSWKAAHRLVFVGVDTPRPLALVEDRFGPLRRRAWLVTEFCKGVDLLAHWPADRVPPPNEGAALLKTIDRLRQAWISHGDFKATNLLWSGGRIVIIDLDAMIQHRSKEAYARAWSRDRARLLRNWPADTVLVRWLDANLPPA